MSVDNPQIRTVLDQKQGSVPNPAEMIAQEYAKDISVDEMKRRLHESYTPEPLAKSLKSSILEKFEAFYNLLFSSEKIGSIINKIQLAKGHVSQPALHANTTTGYLGIIPAALDLLLSLTSYSNTVTNNSRLAYLAAILAFTLIGLFVPPFAPAIGLAIGIAGLGHGAITLANLFYNRYAAQDALDAVDVKINEITDVTRQLIGQYDKLEKQYCEENKKTLADELRKIFCAFEQNLITRNSLLQEKAQYEQQLKAMGSGAVLQISIGIGLGVLGLIGAVTSFIVPPVGLIILATTISLSATFIAASLLKTLGQKIINSFIKKKSEIESNESESTENITHNKGLDSLTQDVSPTMAKEVTRLMKMIENQKVIQTQPVDKKQLPEFSKYDTTKNINAELPNETPKYDTEIKNVI